MTIIFIKKIGSLRRWFSRFREGNLELAAIESNPRLTTQDLSMKFGCSRFTIGNRLHELGFKWKYGIWIPHALTTANLNDRANTAASFLSKSRSIDWLDKLVTGDEKWVLHVNVAKKKMWLRSHEKTVQGVQPDEHEKKIMLCVWWSVHGIDHWEFLDDHSLYCARLQNVADALCRLRPQQDKFNN